MAFGSREPSFGGLVSVAASVITRPSPSRKRCSPRTDESMRAIDEATSGASTRDPRCRAKAETWAGAMPSGVSTPSSARNRA
jgi:hypothetical protein